MVYDEWTSCTSTDDYDSKTKVVRTFDSMGNPIERIYTNKEFAIEEIKMQPFFKPDSEED